MLGVTAALAGCSLALDHGALQGGALDVGVAPGPDVPRLDVPATDSARDAAAMGAERPDAGSLDGARLDAGSLDGARLDVPPSEEAGGDGPPAFDVPALDAPTEQDVGPRDVGQRDGGTDVAPGPYPLGGHVSFLQPGGMLTLAVGSGSATTRQITANGPFAFGDLFGVGTAYDVQVIAQPSGTTCWVRDGSGTVPVGGVSDVDVRCAVIMTSRSSSEETVEPGGAYAAFGPPAISFDSDRPNAWVLAWLYLPSLDTSGPESIGASTTRGATIAIEVAGQVVGETFRNRGRYPDQGSGTTVLALHRLATPGSFLTRALWRSAVDRSLSRVRALYPPAAAAEPPMESELGVIVLDSLRGFASATTETPSVPDHPGPPATFSPVGGQPLAADTVALVGLHTSAVSAMSALPTLRAGAAMHLRVGGAPTVTATSWSGEDRDIARGMSMLAVAALGPTPGALDFEWRGNAGSARFDAPPTVFAAHFGAATAHARATFTGGRHCQPFAPGSPFVSIPGLSATLIAPRAGRALVVFHGHHVWNTNAGRVGAAALARLGVAAPLHLAHVQSFNSERGGPLTMVTVADVPSGASTFAVALREWDADGAACLHADTLVQSDPTPQSVLSAIFLD